MIRPRDEPRGKKFCGSAWILDYARIHYLCPTVVEEERFVMKAEFFAALLTKWHSKLPW
jgi:hypothetical protein